MKRPVVLILLLTSTPALAADKPLKEIDADLLSRGKHALLQENHLNAMWSRKAYEDAWKLWGLDQKPSHYLETFAARYGLHPPPYENNGLPMGLRQVAQNEGAGIAIDCLLCHGGSFNGQSMVGMPNTSLDLSSLFRDLSLSENKLPFPWPFHLNTTRGTTNAGAIAAFVLGFRNPDLTRRILPAYLGWNAFPDLDPPAWWLWSRKRTIYQDGGTDAQSVRATMQFLISDHTAEEIKDLEATWQTVTLYIQSLNPPAYPFEIDEDMARSGSKIFHNHCARCHGNYGNESTYPNRIIPIEEIGTDRARYDAITATFRKHYDESWLGEKYSSLKTRGYQAPPLDGIWATPPYFHNGSVPTVWEVLKSDQRPDRFLRRPDTNSSSYDALRLGWSVTRIRPDHSNSKTLDSNMLFDSSLFGKGNQGHTFGDKLTDKQRWELIEYLKTL